LKKALMIAIPFPPIGGSGVQRTAKFARYLPEFGWQPVVLTLHNYPLREADPSLLDELPADLAIHRVRNLTPLHRLRGDARPGAERPASRRNRPTRPLKLLADLIRAWVLIPDAFIGWFPGALWTGWRLLRREGIDVIYSTSDPFTDHLVAAGLSRLSGKPWVADFRDPWTGYVQYQHTSRRRAAVDRRLEPMILDSADRVVVTCWPAAQDLLARYPHLKAAKFVEITNGFEPADFARPVTRRSDKLTIAYTGRFSSAKNASPGFLRALAGLAEETPRFRAGVEAVFAGLFGPSNHDLVRELNLEDMVKLLGYVRHQDSVQCLLAADVLLLTLNALPGTENTYPGKLFEYFAARKPILALVAQGATADLVREMDAGVVAPPDNVPAIKAALRELYDRHQRGDLSPGPCPDLSRFERRRLAGALAAQLDAVRARRHQGGE